MGQQVCENHITLSNIISHHMTSYHVSAFHERMFAVTYERVRGRIDGISEEQHQDTVVIVSDGGKGRTLVICGVLTKKR